MKNIHVLLIFLIFSCSSKKNINYLQDLEKLDPEKISYTEYKLKVDDNLYIDVKSNIPTTIDFSDQTNLGASMNPQTLEIIGYRIDANGYIDYPEIGKISSAGLTIMELKDNLRKELINNQVFNDPYIDIKLLNAKFTILGEVSSPGEYKFLDNNLNLLEAIGMAGDLTINGIRDDIKIIRNTSFGSKVITVDLTKVHFIESDKFQVFSGDIIIINPNSARVKNAGIIGNSGTLLSLLSFLLSSVIVITNS